MELQDRTIANVSCVGAVDPDRSWLVAAVARCTLGEVRGRLQQHLLPGFVDPALTGLTFDDNNDLDGVDFF